MKTIELPIYGIIVEIDEANSCGSIKSNLKENNRNTRFNAAIDMLESLILAHACAGINIESRGYIIGIETAVDALCNNEGSWNRL